MNKLHALSIDAEFTSFDMIGGDLISFAVIEIMDDFSLGREWQGYFKPRSAIYFTDKAQAVHGISYFKALKFPEPRTSIIELLQWLKPIMEEFPVSTVYWGSWNFDLKWLENTSEQVDLKKSYMKAFKQGKENHINALRMAQDKLKHIPLPNGQLSEKDSKKGQYKLDNVARFYELDHNHHDSLSDARVTAQIYCKMMKGEKIWTGELI